MAFINGYKYTTETEAIAARKAAADYMGLPKNPNDTTIYWVNYNYSELDGFWYITYVDGLESIFGEPIDITITPHEEI
jgi:hypothetical protein